ncbi:MAG: hypothetical protein Q8Q31_02195 [Nanoarchaeota archaeon]|nr:hypothetical protein [Nanoarchaeota archaeon]
MKKEFALLIALLITLSLMPAQVSAQEAIEDSLVKIEDAKDKVDSGIGIITDSPENIKNKYLTKAWGDMISKNKIIGPIHKFFSQYPLPFIIVFNYPYEISLTFFSIFFLWLFITIAVSKQAGSSGLIGDAAAVFLGIFAAIILSQLGLLQLIVTSALSLILSKEAWWARLIISMIIIAFVLALGYINSMIAKGLKEKRKKDKEEKQEQIVQEAESFMQGVGEGQKIMDKISPKSKTDYLKEAARKRASR